MERIFKIKTKTDKDSRTQYPSERRYSASIVIGLSVVFVQLFLCSMLMGTLIIHKMTLHYNSTNPRSNAEETNGTTEDSIRLLYEKLERSLGPQSTPYYINVPALVCAGCFLMSLGCFLSFMTGLLAWKQWYVDHNITLFFLSVSFSTVTSSLALLVSLMTLVHMDFDREEYKYEVLPQLSPLTISLLLNIVILSCIGLIWSVLATKVSYRGMKTHYPDDVLFPKGGRQVEVSTVRKGDKNSSIYPPDIISHFPAKDKLAKYLPKRENHNLPKAESNFEYQQRVNKFLSAEPESTEHQ